MQAKTALISVFNKQGLAPIIQKMNALGITMYSTGGTEAFIKDLGYDVVSVEDVTAFPEILGGRVKTLHPKIFGGILNRQENLKDQEQLKEFNIPQIDIVVVDLYPFEKTLESGATHQEIIEKIDIGGISLIRAAAKNYNDVLCVSCIEDYPKLYEILDKQQGKSTLEQRKLLATRGFMVSSAYDTAIFNYFNENEEISALKISQNQSTALRYGENPHQKGYFFGNFDEIFTQLNGKELSYNNLLDIDAAVNLISEFKNEPTFAILKHNNACGVASRETLKDAYLTALSCDPISAFGGVLIANKEICEQTANEISPLFCEVIIAPSFSQEALSILKAKKNRILLKMNEVNLPKKNLRSCLNGFLLQDKDLKTDDIQDIKYVTDAKPSQKELEDLLFASKICKHTKSNAIVLVKNGQLLASGTGQTSRVDALKQAIEKAKEFNFDLNGAVMASDAFFPFPDCVEIAHKQGIKTIIQPGGSIKDELSIEYCNKNNISMVFTAIRHFKH